MSNKKKKLYKKIRGIKIYKKQTCKKLEKSSLLIKSVLLPQKDSHILKNLHIDFSLKIIFLILWLCLLSGVIFLAVKLVFNDNKTSFIHITFNFKNYTIGEEVKFLKKKWYVVEDTNKDMARRILDFLSGVAYANRGKIKRVATNTYIIIPSNVDLTGDDLLDELENNGVYFG